MSAHSRGYVPVTRIALAAVLLSLVCGGWVAYRVAARRSQSADRAPEVALVSAAGQGAATPPTDAPDSPTAPAPREPGTPPPAEPTVTAYPEPPDEAPAPAKLPPPAGAGDEPAIDDIVKKEAPKYAAGEKAKGDVVVLTPVAARAGGARDPGRVAAEIDRILDARLAAAGTPASPPAAPAEFHRRAYLDITGCIPPVAKTRAFLGDISPDRQARLIEELLAAHDYGDHFAQYWHELLVKRDPENNGPIQTHDVYVKWLTRQFNQNRPWDQVVKTMLTAEGDQALAGETFFVLANSENGQPAPDKIVGTAAALFLGNQLQCAECHVHPVVSKWTQQDFWGLAAFFGRTRAVRNGAAKMPTEVLARIVDGGPAPAPKKGAAAMPGTLPDGSIAIPDPRTEGRVIGVARAKLFGDGFAPVPPNSVTRAFAADWFASARNPFFARAAVNRLWSVFFGRGLVNPLDDIRPDSRVSHLEVLELLAEEFAASGYDVKHLVRCLCRTAAYQRSSRTLPQNKDDDELYSHMAVKVIPPRTLFACLALVTNNQIRSPREDRGGKNGAPADGIGFYDTREYDESPTEYTNGVPQLLRLMNTQLPPACEAVARSLRGGGSRESVVEHLYLLALGRPPTPTEADRLGRFIGTQNDPVKGYAIALWVLLQTSEFFNNH